MKWLIGIAVTAAVTTLGVLALGGSRLTRRSSVYVQNRTLYGPGGFQYRLTDNDLLWLARAVWGEAGERPRGGAAVIWAMAQYHALVLGSGGSRPKFGSLTALLRAYCQPINPRWASTSASGCQDRPSACSAHLLERRARITNVGWGDIPSSVRGLVTQFSQGTLSNPVPGMTDWAAADWSSRSQVRLINISGNRFGVGRDRRLWQGA